jgi:hypothetical protein
MPPRRNRLTSVTFKDSTLAGMIGPTMLLRLRLWIRRKWAWRKPASAFSDLPFELDEFARLLKSRDPAVLKQLANDLAKPVAVTKQSGELQA